MASGLLKGYDSYDGAPFSEEISEGRVKYLDLTLPQYGLPLYDWIISLEVAEHIPREYENIYLDNIVRHAKEGVILSWARPGKLSCCCVLFVFFVTRNATSDGRLLGNCFYLTIKRHTTSHFLKWHYAQFSLYLNHIKMLLLVVSERL